MLCLFLWGVRIQDLEGLRIPVVACPFAVGVVVLVGTVVEVVPVEVSEPPVGWVVDVAGIVDCLLVGRLVDW